MREIKFRAWDKSRKSMRTSRSMMIFFDGRIFPNNQDSFRPEDFILMQYTGLKDKNGKEIYEGDILHWPYRRDIIKTGEVIWDQMLSGFTVNMYQLTDARDYDVIGNIWETPELLTNS